MADNLRSLVRNQFGRAAADYAASDVHAKGESLARLVALSHPERSWHAIDIATGAGHMAAAFAPHVASIIASDLTQEMLSETEKLAASRNLANMTTMIADAGALPFEKGTFDLVCCRLAAHHFPSLDRFVSEAKRVLKKGGRFALVDNVAPDRSQFPRATAAELEEVVAAYNDFEKLRDPSHGFAPPPSTWIGLLERHGFSIVAREQFGKELAFSPWVNRMRCAPDVIKRLETILTGGPALLRQFLEPRRDESDALHFTLQEMLLVAEKPG